MPVEYLLQMVHRPGRDDPFLDTKRQGRHGWVCRANASSFVLKNVGLIFDKFHPPFWRRRGQKKAHILLLGKTKVLWAKKTLASTAHSLVYVCAVPRERKSLSTSPLGKREEGARWVLAGSTCCLGPRDKGRKQGLFSIPTPTFWALKFGRDIHDWAGKGAGPR